MSDKDYDEIDSDYGDAEDDPKAFKIREPLPLPTASVHTTLELHALIHEGLIDLNPPYQRDVVWGQDKQIALIESIFRNFYVPPILFLLQQEEGDDGPVRVCMDGKQRLTSILMFFDGQIPYKDPVTKKKWYYQIPDSMKGKREVIPDAFKRQFAAKHITCVEYQNIDASMERDIFQRVQLGVSLSAAEKLQAISSPYADWINDLEIKHVFLEKDGLANLLPWDTKRGQSFKNLAQFIFCVEKLPGRSDPSGAKLTTWLHRVDTPGQAFKREIDDVLNTFWTIASSPEWKGPLWTQKVSPVEFVFIAVLLAVISPCDYEYKSAEIGHMRKFVRTTHKDVRFNSRVVDTLWNFIDIAMQRAPSSSVKVSNGSSSGNPRKRRRNGDDSDGDYRPTPIRSLGATPTTRSRGTK